MLIRLFISLSPPGCFYFKKLLCQVRQLSSEGVKEVTLLGQNVNSYHDKSKSSGVIDISLKAGVRYDDTPLYSMGEKADSGRQYESTAGFRNTFRMRDGEGARFADLLDAVARCVFSGRGWCSVSLGALIFLSF
jgi:hypothetical protein